MTNGDIVMSKSHRIKGGTTDEAFQKQCFLWERGATVGADFELLYIQYLHKNLYNTLKGREKNVKAYFSEVD